MTGQSRQGFTLIEMLLVLAIICIVAALALPMMGGAMTGDKLTAATDMVKSRLTEMQCRAREEGQPYHMVISDSGDSFRIEPLPDCTTGADPSTTATPGADEQLPKDITFKGCTAISTDGQGDTNTTSEIIVLPDGTSPQTFEVSFGPAQGRSMVVRVHGLSGALSAAPGGEGGR